MFYFALSTALSLHASVLVPSTLDLLPSALPQADSIKKLDFLLGNWTSTEKMSRANGEAVTITLKGKNDWALGGTALRIEESFDFPGAGTVHNFILMTYDQKAKSYLAFWFTNNSPRPIEFSGNFEGANFILTSVKKDPPAGPEIRITYKPQSKTEFAATLEVKSGDTWTTRTEAKYIKGG